MNFKYYLKEQFNMHPSMTSQDVAKMCYQAVFGAEHVLNDQEGARLYFYDEFEQVEADDNQPLYEPISDEVCRVNMAAWKGAGLPGEWLFKMFTETASVSGGSKEKQMEWLKEAGKMAEEGCVNLDSKQWNDFMKAYTEEGCPAVHHSEEYRLAEQPSYRIVKRQFMKLIPVLEMAAEVVKKNDTEDETCVIAIDGRAASGKSTMALQLAHILNCDIVEMDDFFLPPGLRTPERFSEAGGNVHWERFCREVLPYLRKKGCFEYGVFDCIRMEIGTRKTINTGDYIIVEGSYSYHPRMGEYADITVFSHVEPEEQIKRIKVRNGDEMAEMFKDRWIPLEEEYFKAYNIEEKALIKLI